MAVILNRHYSGFASGALVTFDPATEAGLVAQALAAYASPSATNPDAPPGVTPVAAIPAGRFGPAVVTNIPMGAVALTTFQTNGVAQTAFATNITEIFVPHWNTWTGAGYLNGTGVGTDSAAVFLFNTEGDLIAQSAIGGTLNAAGASVFEKVAFTAPITLAPGRDFVGLAVSGTTVTPRHVLSANGAEPRCAVIATTTSLTAAAGVLAANPITVPTTFTTALAPIVQLYS
jgi:hypothetical protein